MADSDEAKKTSGSAKLSPSVREASSRSRQRKLKNKNTATKRNKVKLGKRDGKATRSASRAQKISRSNSSRRHKVSSTKRSSGSAKRSGTSSRKSAKTSRKRPSSKTTKTKSNKTKKRKPKSAHAAITEGADEMEVTEEPVIMMDQEDEEEQIDAAHKSTRVDWNSRSMGLDGNQAPSDAELEKLRQEEEEKQEEEESADTAPPKKVLVGWGGSEALEKAPINLRAEFTRHVQDASSSPHASTSSKAQPELAANEANSAAANDGAEAAASARAQPATSAQRSPKLSRAAQRAKRRKARLKRRGDKAFTKRNVNAIAKTTSKGHPNTYLSVDTATPERKKSGEYRDVKYKGNDRNYSRGGRDPDDDRRYSDSSDDSRDRGYNDRRSHDDSYSSSEESRRAKKGRDEYTDSYDSRSDSDRSLPRSRRYDDDRAGDMSDASHDALELSASEIGRKIYRKSIEKSENERTPKGHASMMKRTASVGKKNNFKRNFVIPKERSARRQFLCNPIHPDFGTMQCMITRTPDKVMYLLQLEKCTGLPHIAYKEPPFLLNGKKRRNKTQFNFLISDDEYEMSRMGPGCLAKLRGNSATTEYTLYDQGCKPQAKYSDSGRDYRKELMCIAITKAGTFGLSKGPRAMTVICPKVTGGTSLVCQPKTDSSRERLANWKPDKTMRLMNKPPYWNKIYRKYILNFNGRVKEASVKNFQLIVADSESDSTTFQCGRTGKNTFIVDFSYPLSPVQAFAIAVCSLTT